MLYTTWRLAQGMAARQAGGGSAQGAGQRGERVVERARQVVDGGCREFAAVCEMRAHIGAHGRPELAEDRLGAPQLLAGRRARVIRRRRGCRGAGLVAIAVFQSLNVARAVAVTGGSALLLGWVLGPVLVTGMDTTVDADKLAPFPLTTRQVMLALTVTGLTGIPGIATSIAALATVALWVRWPLAALVAVPCIALAVLTCVVASRLVSALSTVLGGNRRGRELVGTVVLVLLIMSGPIITGTLALLGSARDLGEQVRQIAGVLSWTPIGATWAVPGDVAAGAWGSAALKLLIALATLGVLWMLWARALHGATTAPRQRAAKVARSGALGLFGRMPTGGIGATWARSLTAWLRDPRYLGSCWWCRCSPATSCAPSAGWCCWAATAWSTRA